MSYIFSMLREELERLKSLREKYLHENKDIKKINRDIQVIVEILHHKELILNKLPKEEN